MKKIVLCLLMLTSSASFAQVIDVIDFKVNEPSNQNFNSGTRIDFEFKIKGDYSYGTHGHHQIDLLIYKNSVSPTNELARSYWNREDDTDLIFNSYTTKNWWNTSLKSYSTFPGQVFKLVVKYAGLTKTLTYTYPKSNLLLNPSGSVITSDCFGCDIIFSNLGSDRHYVNNPTGIANLDILVENNGDGDSNSGTVGIYVSANSTFESGSDTLIKSFNLNSIADNSTRFVSGALFASDFGGFGGNFWLIIRIDDTDTSNETNESDNTYSLRFGVY